MLKKVLYVSPNLVEGEKATIIIGISLQEGENLLLGNIKVELRKGGKHIIVRGSDEGGRLWVVELSPKTRSGWATVK